MAKKLENKRDLVDFDGLGGAVGGAFSGNNLGLTNIMNIAKTVGNTDSYQPITDTNFTSGLYYANSIAGGQNVPNMIAPGVSYSSAMPQGYSTGATQAPPVFQPAPPSYAPPVEEPIQVPPPIFSPAPPINIGGPVEPPISYPPINFPPVSGPVEPPIQVPPVFYDDPIMPPINIGGPVDMPFPPKIEDQLFIDGRPGLEEILNTDYVVPQVPLNNLLNQNPPQTPVGMSPQETAKVSSQQELLNLISNKNELTQIPADDGVRNKYQVELDEFINKSPINMDTYKEELPVGSAINLGIPAFMESVVPMAVPGLGLAKNISDSFQNDFSPSPSQSFEPSPVPSFNRGIDYSNIYKFGR